LGFDHSVLTKSNDAGSTHRQARLLLDTLRSNFVDLFRTVRLRCSGPKMGGSWPLIRAFLNFLHPLLLNFPPRRHSLVSLGFSKVLNW
jgi:hypothetical protein